MNIFRAFAFATTRLAFCSVVVLAPLSTALALDLDPDEIRGKSSKEPVQVLQNRYFLKAYRPEFGLMVGQIMDEAYLNTNTMGARAGLFFNEWIGFEVQGLRTMVRDSEDRKALNGLTYRPLEEDTDNSGNAIPNSDTTVSPDPEVNAIHSVTDFNVIAAPFYGKLNLMNKWIIYTDLYAVAGMSRIESDQGDKMAINLGAGERFYIGKAWSFRIDFKDRIFNEERAGKATRKHSYSVDIGGGYFFN